MMKLVHSEHVCGDLGSENSIVSNEWLALCSKLRQRLAVKTSFFISLLPKIRKNNKHTLSSKNNKLQKYLYSPNIVISRQQTLAFGPIFDFLS